MRTCVKTPLVILSALALLAGCKSSPAKASFLLVDSDAVHFVQWTQEGKQIKGTIELVGITHDNEIETTSAMFDGVLDGENVSMATKTWGKFRGRLGRDILTVFVDMKGEVDLRRATPAEYAEATKNFKMRAALNKGAK